MEFKVGGSLIHSTVFVVPVSEAVGAVCIGHVSEPVSEQAQPACVCLCTCVYVSRDTSVLSTIEVSTRTARFKHHGTFLSIAASLHLLPKQSHLDLTH